MSFNLDFSNRGRAWGKIHATRAVDRYEAAIRLELIRQQLREATRYGFTVTAPMAAEVREAEAEYNEATALLNG